MMNSVSPEILAARAKIVSRIRAFFDSRDFIEVSTPVRIPAPAPEPHILCPASGDWFLRASPELQMKKLLALGCERIYQIGPCFREGERGSRHLPEFTMLEWYRTNASYLEIADDAERLLSSILDLPAPFERISVRDAYLRFAGWDPLADWDQDRFDFDMAAKIEPALPRSPVFLFDYPAPAASLSRLKPSDPRLAERWELYVGGIELANAFTELTDPAEQRARFEAARAERKAAGESDYPLDLQFLESLSALPPTGGVALGVDRLVMLATGSSGISQVTVTE